MNFTRATNGDIVKGDVKSGARSDAYIQTDLTVHHQIPLTESRRLDFEANVSNLFNQRAATVYYEFAIPTNLINASRASRFPGDLGVDFGKVDEGLQLRGCAECRWRVCRRATETDAGQPLRHAQLVPDRPQYPPGGALHLPGDPQQSLRYATGIPHRGRPFFFGPASPPTGESAWGLDPARGARTLAVSL
ncbi:MAG: hypothetical protein HY858_03665 [Candidatus Solibacter usitatus]|nr:hypothetical protein [Candidatus Solibacter usitatus]